MRLHTLHAKDAIAFALHLDVREKAFTDIDDVAREFGLRPLGQKWRRIDRDTASNILFVLLLKDLAHHSPRVSEEEARTATHEFLSSFASEGTFFTNGKWEDGWTSRPGFEGVRFGPEVESATDATFDGGVVAFDRLRCGILWLEDED